MPGTRNNWTFCKTPHYHNKRIKTRLLFTLAPSLSLIMSDMDNAKRLELLYTLRDAYDHLIVKVKVAERYAKAFGCRIKTHSYPSHLLFDPSGSNKGLSSDSLAEQLCQQFNLAYDVKFGRGSQLRECCEKLIEHFSKAAAAPPLPPTPSKKRARSSSSSSSSMMTRSKSSKQPRH